MSTNVGKRKSTRGKAGGSSKNGSLKDMFQVKKKRKEDEDDVKTVEKKDLIVASSSSSSTPSIGSKKQIEEDSKVPERQTITSEKEKKKKKKKEEVVPRFPYEDKLGKAEQQDAKKGTLPYAIFNTVHYEPRGNSTDTLQTQFGPSPREIFNKNVNNKRVFAYVVDNFEIPNDFDKVAGIYGPRSGLCHEERVIRAYENNLLTAKGNKKATTKMCTECGDMGHFSKDCPTKL